MKDKVYYDENCYVCSLEINAIRSRGEACGIEFVDISSDEFKTGGRDYDSEMVGQFDGEETIGIETFRKMYEAMGFNRAVAFSRLPAIRNVFNASYYIFAHWIRPRLPRRSDK